ncbi:MAG TPA: M48 family metallopeptidase [Burkholderiales bacterium]|nr:M48 family metallopeptidase [Burkholderiales bacterium]
MQRAIFPIVAALAVGGAGCQTVDTTKAGVVGVDRDQRMMVSAEQMHEGAEKAYAQMMAEAKAKGALNRSPAQVERVRGIAKRLIVQIGTFRDDAEKWNWEANVISSKDVNAWAMPGGKMAVYTGLIERLDATEDELAAVMGHEIAHALREHGRERASRAMGQGLLLSVLGAAAGMSGSAMDLSQMVLDVTLNLPNSRTHETEADRIGVELAARAGYDPRAAISLWEKMAKAGGGGPPEFLSTHPSHETRISDLREYSRKVMPLYQKAKR